MSTAHGISARSHGPRPPSGSVRFVTETLRGVGQVDLQENLATGAFITIALFSAGWKPGVFGLLGAAVSTWTAIALRVERDKIVNGLEGYCGALIGIAAVTFLGLHLSTWIVAITGAVACTVLTATLGTMLGTWGLPALTGPFCIVGSAIAIGGPGFERIWHGGTSAALPDATTGGLAMTFGNLVESFFTNVAEIFLLDKWWAGLIMLVGLGVASRKVLIMACAGSAIGTLTAWALGAPADLITSGIYGYNAVLVMIALGATFLAPTPLNYVYAAICAVFSVLLTATLADFFAPFGGQTAHLSELFGAAVAFSTLERAQLEVSAFRKARDFGAHFRERYGPTIAAEANARRHDRGDEFVAALDRFCDEWNRGPVSGPAQFRLEYLLAVGTRG